MSMKEEREKGDMASVGTASSSPPKAIVWVVAECLDLLSVYDYPRRLFLMEGFAMESSRRARDAGPSLSSHQSWLLSCNTALAREQTGAADLPPVLRHAKSGPKKTLALSMVNLRGGGGDGLSCLPIALRCRST